MLIDGDHLARLMIRHGVGCRIEETLHVKKVDEEFLESKVSSSDSMLLSSRPRRISESVYVHPAQRDQTEWASAMVNMDAVKEYMGSWSPLITVLK